MTADRKSPVRPTYSIGEIKSMLLAQLDGVVSRYAPPASGSYTKMGSYFTLNPGRADRSVGSFYVQMSGAKAGRWQDFAVGDVQGEGYGDVLDLIALSLGCSMTDAIKEARSFLGLQTDSPEDVQRRKRAAALSAQRRADAELSTRKERVSRARAGQAIWLGGQERIKGTPVEFYLRDERGIDLARLGRQPGVLRYVPELKYYHVDPQSGEVFEGSYPAMVAIITNSQGLSVGVHRTYLAPRPDGQWGKAPVPTPKKVLGDYHAAAIHIWKGIGPRGGKPLGLRHAPSGTHVFIAEGVEDALSCVMLKPDARVLAAISLGNLGQVQLPEAVTDVTLVADLDENETARAALHRAIAQHQKCGRVVRLFQNKWGGKDLNDALLQARTNKSNQQGERYDPMG